MEENSKEYVQPDEKEVEDKGDANINDVCRDCLKWKAFSKNCWVYWDRKKTCTMKITREDQWQDAMMY